MVKAKINNGVGDIECNGCKAAILADLLVISMIGIGLIVDDEEKTFKDDCFEAIKTDFIEFMGKVTYRHYTKEVKTL